MNIMVCVINFGSHETYIIIHRSPRTIRNYYYYLNILQFLTITFLRHRVPIYYNIFAAILYHQCNTQDVSKSLFFPDNLIDYYLISGRPVPYFNLFYYYL